MIKQSCNSQNKAWLMSIPYNKPLRMKRQPILIGNQNKGYEQAGNTRNGEEPHWKLVKCKFSQQ